MDHAEGARNFLVEVRDHRKRDLHVEVLLDVAYPGDVRVNAVNGDADQLHVAAVEVVRVARELYELGGAHWREVGRMREQHHPFAFRGVVAQADDAVG